MLHSSKCWWLWKEPVMGWHWWLWKEPLVMCGNWNVRQATSQQLYRVTTFCTDTRLQSFSPLINCIVHHALLKFSACCKKDAVIYWGQDCWLATCQDWWTAVSHSAETRLCHEHDVLAHCLAGRQTRLHQCCGSLVVASASATCLGNTVHWVLLQAEWRWGWYSWVWIL